jgi:hypothetical protein
MSRSLLLVLCMNVAAMIASAQGLPAFPDEEVLVIVWSGSDRCSVMDRKTNCSRVARIMNSPLQIGRDRRLVVAPSGNDQDTRIRVAQLMTDIRAAGFRRVRQADPPR